MIKYAVFSIVVVFVIFMKFYLKHHKNKTIDKFLKEPVSIKPITEDILTDEERYELNVKREYNNLPFRDWKKIKGYADKYPFGAVIPGTGKYEYCIYLRDGYRFLFYPHRTSNGNYHTRVRPLNNKNTADSRAILLDFINMGFKCKTLPEGM